MTSPQTAPPRLDVLRIAAHLAGLLPVVLIGLAALQGRLTANPIQYIEQALGRGAAYLLLASLAVTPVVTLTGWRALIRQRRTLGLYAFANFMLHLLTVAVVDYGLNWGELARLVVEKPYILAGAAAGLILLALAVTSFPWWKKRLGKGWKRLHRLAYLAGGLVMLHYFLAVKGSLATLSGDIARPLALSALLAVLLALRLPPVRRRAAALGQLVRGLLRK